MNNLLKLLPLAFAAVWLTLQLSPQFAAFVDLAGKLAVISALSYQLSSLVAKKWLKKRAPSVSADGKAVLITGKCSMDLSRCQFR